jgi:Leucine-rich repeat (LRR) protein
LDLSYNSHKGIIPNEIGALMTLATLDLSFNKLTGSISKSLSDYGLVVDIDEDIVACSCCQ